METSEMVGSALMGLLNAQEEDDALVQHDRLENLARSLVQLSDSLGSPLVWPVGPAAERIAGASVVLSRGAVRVRGWNTEICGEHVLVVATALLTNRPILAAARQAELLGASGVFACGVNVEGVEGLASSVKDYFVLHCADPAC